MYIVLLHQPLRLRELNRIRTNEEYHKLLWVEHVVLISFLLLFYLVSTLFLTEEDLIHLQVVLHIIEFYL